MVQFRASPVMMVYSTALRLMTGSTPGMPRHTGQTRVFGSAPNTSARQPQNILDLVFSWAWTSMPMMGS